MPTYEYRCTNGHTFEAFQSITDDPIAACEVCGAPCERVLFAPAVHFKGSGFYTTDYARKGSSDGGKGGSNKSDAQTSDAASEKAEKAEKAGTSEKSDKSDKADTSAKSDSGGSSSSDSAAAKPAAKAESK